MLAAREDSGEWCTLCTDPNTAMRQAFDHMKHLFWIQEIQKARLRITDGQQYYHGFKVLDRIKSLKYLDLHTEVPIEEEKLKAVLDLGPFVYLKISFPEHIAFTYTRVEPKLSPLFQKFPFCSQCPIPRVSRSITQLPIGSATYTSETCIALISAGPTIPATPASL